MPSNCILDDEAGRLSALDRAMIVDTGPEMAFDKITTLVQTVLNVPIALVSLIDRDRQWLKSKQGLDIAETPREVSFCTHTIRRAEPMLVPDALRDPRFATNPLVLGAPFIRSYAGVPLCSPDGYNLGTLCAIDIVPRHFQPSQIAILSSFAALAVDEIELRLIAQTDSLTGALTRRAFISKLDRIVSRHTSTGDRNALIAMDIDRFKRINDTLGHAVGDVVLREIAACCGSLMRAEDAFGRIGGEEFCMLLPDTDTFQAARAAERLRQAIAAITFPGYPALQVTASFGIAPLTADTTTTAWMARADAALYAAKQSGRNRWSLAA